MIQKKWLPNKPVSSLPDPLSRIPARSLCSDTPGTPVPAQQVSSHPALRPLKPHSVTHGAISRLMWNFLLAAGRGALLGPTQGVLIPTADDLLLLESALERPTRHCHLDHRSSKDTTKGRAFKCIRGQGNTDTERSRLEILLNPSSRSLPGSSASCWPTHGNAKCKHGGRQPRGLSSLSPSGHSGGGGGQRREQGWDAGAAIPLGPVLTSRFQGQGWLFQAGFPPQRNQSH